jgi:hypothetical protein
VLDAYGRYFIQHTKKELFMEEAKEKKAPQSKPAKPKQRLQTAESVKRALKEKKESLKKRA